MGHLRYWLYTQGTLAVLLLLNAAVTVSAQRQQIDVDHADLLEVQQRNNRVIQRLVGNVELSQDSVFMYCDSATLENSVRLFGIGRVTIQQGDSTSAFADTLYYNATTQEADLINEVVLVNGTRRLHTDRLRYNLKTRLATYTNGATITNGQTQLSSRRGYYYTRLKTVFFRDSVVVIDPRFEMRADTLRYDAINEIVYFLGPTVIRTDSSRIYCEAGFYDVRTNTAEFRENAQYERGQQQATADIIRYQGDRQLYTLAGRARFKEGEQRVAIADTIGYDQRNDVTTLQGDAYFRDSVRTISAATILYDAKQEIYRTTGRSLISDPPNLLEADAVDYRESEQLGIATGNVIWRDTSAQLTINSGEARYNQSSGYLKASGGVRGRPLLVTLIDQDSVFVSADTLLSVRADSLAGDSSRLLHAYRDVRIFGAPLQALCDSLSYSTLDSTFQLFRAPIIWADTSQFSADTVNMRLRGQQVDQIFLHRNAFIVNSPDEVFFNQIKGKDIVARFDSNELRQMNVQGNAESLYYAQDDEGAYVGVNKAAASEMVLDFAANRVTSILLLQAPSGRLNPMNAVNHEQLRLEGFNWNTDIRPASIEDLFGPPLRATPVARPVPRPQSGAQEGDLSTPDNTQRE